MASMLAVHASLSYRAEVCLSAIIARRWPQGWCSEVFLEGGGSSRWRRRGEYRGVICEVRDARDQSEATRHASWRVGWKGGPLVVQH